MSHIAFSWQEKQKQSDTSASFSPVYFATSEHGLFAFILYQRWEHLKHEFIRARFPPWFFRSIPGHGSAFAHLCRNNDADI